MQQSFQTRVYTIASQIPIGKVATYKQIAQMAGNPKAARAVGMFMRNNHNPHIVPCHRVVSYDGKLTGYAFGGVHAKKEILIKEGVIFVGDRVSLSQSQWKTSKQDKVKLK